MTAKETEDGKENNKEEEVKKANDSQVRESTKHFESEIAEEAVAKVIAGKSD